MNYIVNISSKLIIGLFVFMLPALATDKPLADYPHYTLASSDAYDFSQISAYAGKHGRIYAYIDENLDDHFKNIQRWVRQRSISAQNVGITEMAELLRDDLAAIGFSETTLVPSAGHPGVWGYYDAGATKTLLVYMMYDVQPVNEDDWESPPFEGKLVERDFGQVLMARGATNQKGPQRAFLNAIESIIKVNGTLPVNLMVLAEGEEELGSPNYPQLVDAYEARLKTADGVLFPFNSQNLKGELTVLLGVKGINYWELESKGGSWGGPGKSEIHGSYKSVVDSPTQRLIAAIASMTTADGNTILIDGYYDDVRPPTVEESMLINAMSNKWSAADWKKQLSLSQFIHDQKGEAVLMRYLYDVTLNVDGIWSGYTGEGVKTILPHIATAKMDSRLPMGIDPDTQFARLRKHLDEHGFSDIIIRKLSGYPAAQTSVDAPLVQAAMGVFSKWANITSVMPRIGGSAPFYQFTERLGLPLVFNGLGHGSGAHGPNEYMLIYPHKDSKVAGLADIEKSYVDLLFALAEPAN
ncbi:MAG: M20/M25/M40 family metallo-hydrolase [Xanthomonadales bacterium]|nr:M20/M25/M40 family metallo-hydrolase [Xanthomonadales bacterium]